MIKGEEEVGRKNRGGDLESAIKEERGKKGDDFETVGQEDLETVGQEDSAPPAPPAPPRRILRKSGPPSCYVGTRSQDQDKANNAAVRRSTKVDK